MITLNQTPDYRNGSDVTINHNRTYEIKKVSGLYNLELWDGDKLVITMKYYPVNGQSPDQAAVAAGKWVDYGKIDRKYSLSI